MTTRIIWIDYLKVLAIIGVIGIHCSSHLLNDSYLFTLPWYESVISASIFRFAIILFILASGYLLLRKPQQITSIPRRLKRIIIPFIFWIIIYAIIKVLFKAALGSSWTIIDLAYFIGNSFLDPLQISVQFWYVYMIIGLYLLSPILSTWIQNADMNEIEYFLAVWLIISLLQFLCINTVLFDYLIYFTGSIGYFILGYYLTIKDHPILNNKKYGLIMFIVGSIFTIMGTIIFSHLQASQSLFFIRLGDITPGAFLQSIGLFIIIKNIDYTKIKPEINNFIIRLSKDTYGIYLVNILVVNFLTKINLFSTEKYTLIMILINILLTLVISEIIIEVLHRLPYLRSISARA